MDLWSLGDTRAIVTGAGRGSARQIVAEMLGLGATVLGVTPSREDLERLREVNPSAGDRLHVFSAALTDASQRRPVMESVKFRGPNSLGSWLWTESSVLVEADL